MCVCVSSSVRRGLLAAASALTASNHIILVPRKRSCMEQQCITVQRQEDNRKQSFLWHVLCLLALGNGRQPLLAHLRLLSDGSSQRKVHHSPESRRGHRKLRFPLPHSGTRSYQYHSGFVESLWLFGGASHLVQDCFFIEFNMKILWLRLISGFRVRCSLEFLELAGKTTAT